MQVKMLRTGAAKNTTVLALLGKTGSLIRSFNPSAMVVKFQKNLQHLDLYVVALKPLLYVQLMLNKLQQLVKEQQVPRIFAILLNINKNINSIFFLSPTGIEPVSSP